MIRCALEPCVYLMGKIRHTFFERNCSVSLKNVMIAMYSVPTHHEMCSPPGDLRWGCVAEMLHKDPVLLQVDAVAR
jgi:hypothetical protein